MPYSSESPVVLWRGFRHQWRYNHVPLRLGSTIRHDHRDVESLVTEYSVGHPEASSGTDTVSFRDRFTELQVTGIACLPQTVRLSVPRDGGISSQPMRVQLPAGSNPGTDAAVVLLNGFDLEVGSEGVQTFAVGVSSPVLEPGRTLNFSVHSLVRSQTAHSVTHNPTSANTPSSRPPAGGRWDDVMKVLDPAQAPLSNTQPNGRAGHQLTVEILVVTGPAEILNVMATCRCENAYSWDTDSPVEREDVGICSVSFEGASIWSRDRAESTLGYRSLALDLQLADGEDQKKAMRLMEWDVANRRLRCRADSVVAELDVFFKNWRPGMETAQLPDSRVSMRQAGSVRMAIDPVLLQFDREATLLCEPSLRIASKSRDGASSLTDQNEETFRVERRKGLARRTGSRHGSTMPSS